MTTVDELPEATGATGDNAAWRRLGWRQTLLLNLGPAVGAAVRGAPGGVMTRTRTRMTAGQRREMVLQAALAEFAARGLDGASTQDIARGAGISQPYPVPARRDQEGAVRVAGPAVLPARGGGVRHGGRRPGRRGRVAGHRERLREAVPAADAAADAGTRLYHRRRPGIRAAARAAFGDLRDSVERLTGLPPAQVQRWFGAAMLMTAATAMDLPATGTTPNCVTKETAMHPAISYELATAQAADMRQQAQRDARARAARPRAGRTRARLSVDGSRCEALFASGLQPSDTPDADSVAEAIRATVRRFGIGGCASRMAQEFGDHPEAAAERMCWARSVLGLTPSRPLAPPARSAHLPVRAQAAAR